MKELRAPFPWFGGKSRVAPVVWRRFGNTRNYVEPFAGSLAVLLGRPTPPAVETVNDIDCYLANLWRALSHDPEQVAHYADWPVNEADLHARHRWLVKTGKERVERLRTDPDYFDAQVAGWWVWGQCLWIGRLRKGNHALQDSVLGADPGHSIYCAAGSVLTNGDSARIADGGHAF